MPALLSLLIRVCSAQRCMETNYAQAKKILDSEEQSQGHSKSQCLTGASRMIWQRKQLSRKPRAKISLTKLTRTKHKDLEGYSHQLLRYIRMKQELILLLCSLLALVNLKGPFKDFIDCAILSAVLAHVFLLGLYMYASVARELFKLYHLSKLSEP
eukprot:1136606-Pelagomonas_calceolata.AAC.2